MAELDRPFDRRRAGVLLHVTSLPGRGASTHSNAGDLGDEAYRFIDFLAAAGCSVWQVLPLAPTHPGDGSPYNVLSAMAGSTAMISREHQAAQQLDAPSALEEQQQAAFSSWCAAQAGWLEPYVEFTALRELHDHAPWLSWPAALRDRDPRSVADALAHHTDRMQSLRFEQWVFSVQWARLREYAASKDVLLFGDLPIFVSLDSADVWAGRDLFQLDEDGRPITVSGCPPDYFAADGQRWNNPHYDWDAMAADGFDWWRRRVARQRELFDLIRIDHFRAFEAAWHVPVDAATARDGRWVPGPGAAILSVLVDTAGPGTLVAEDLGVITPEVEELRVRFDLPGMKVLQFAFDGDDDNPYLPHRHGEHSVVYTGTHDNDTTTGWWQLLDEETRVRVSSWLSDSGEAMPWALIRLALESTSRLCVVPAQDLLELGSQSRMNTPGTAQGNWAWQTPAGAFDDRLAARMRELVAATDRLVEELKKG